MATHHFVPDRYHTTFGTHDPVLTIADGDSVATSTVDAAGRDASEASVTAGGNPQTGPFYVEGAGPGDALAVRLDQLWPNRRRGMSGMRLAANVVDPADVLAFPRDATEVAVWDIDTEGWTATLSEPPNLKIDLALPLRPMLGCLGVAPARGEAISTATSGRHGGNMDYNGLVEGVTVHFPVFVEGALLFLGDGHAVQGDGEIVGSGIETSFDVRFTVQVLKGKKLTWPRAENATHLMTIGNARPLDQALQHATSEMTRWLQEDLRLDVRALHTFLGQCVEYDVGNVYDPAFTMVCKVSKQLLAQLRA